jgi:hypothetical protein
MNFKLFYKWFRFILLIEVLAIYASFSNYISPKQKRFFDFTDTVYHNFDTVDIYPPVVYKPRPIVSLSLEDLWDYYAINPCYLPLIADSALWEKGKNIGFKYSDLFNDSLSDDNKYVNRYLVGDFNVVDRYGNRLNLQEVYPRLKNFSEFDSIPEIIVARMDSIPYGTPAYDSLVNDIRIQIPESADEIINFLYKVWQYKMLAISREYSIYWSSLFSAGQYIVMCEACEDTLVMVGKFATSAKRLTIRNRYDADGNIVEYYSTRLPIGASKSYYAGLNTISSKHWEYARSYDYYDKKRDQELGGGHDRIVMYKDRVQLPNFLSLVPSPDYPDAMTGNGIHEVALSDVARGMLGTANSLGCLRVSDFGAKFLRWWTPQDCKFFIAYNDTCYDDLIEYQGDITDYLPFKNEEEGIQFRQWLNNNYPYYAEILEIDEEGSYRNGYIIDGYFYFKDEYEKFLAYRDSLKSR